MKQNWQKRTTMEPKRLYTLRWTQLYAIKRDLLHAQLLRHSQKAVERAIEAQLERNDCPEAKLIIEKIRNASKS